MDNSKVVPFGFEPVYGEETREKAIDNFSTLNFYWHK
jgi:hypothetical protein